MITTTHIKELLNTCMQCGTCTASCPNAFAMDMPPRKLWRLVLMDRTEDIFNSTTFSLCSTCYYCTLRCPRGLPLTRIMSLLKEQAFKAKTPGYKKGTAFYGSFMESVRRHGRVRETEFMTLYFMAMKNPLLPFEFAGIGLKLMRKNKVAIQFPSGPDDSNLDRLFKKVKEIEDLKEAGNAQEQYE